MTTARFRLLPSISVFVDTSAFFAASYRADAHYATATAIMGRLASGRSQLFTSNFILAETHALLLRRMGRQYALRLLDQVYAGSTNVVRATEADEQRARDILHRYDDKDFSLTDALSFSIVERLGIDAAFSFDSDFAQYGLRVLES